MQPKLDGKGPPYFEGRKIQNRIEKSSSHHVKMILISNVNWTMMMISLFPIRKPSTGLPKPSVILIHSRKKLR